MKMNKMLRCLIMLTIVAGVSSMAFGASADAGPDQEVGLTEASTTGFSLDSTISDPNVGEIFTYSWSGGFDTITDNDTTTAADPNVTFTEKGDYVLTLDVTSDQGAELSDTVNITVLGASLDAGLDQSVGLPVAVLGGVALNSTISDANALEVFTYNWSGGFATGDNNYNTTTAADPTVTFTATGVYVLTLDVTSDEGAELSDTVTITVVGVSLDAGPNQTVQWSAAQTGVALNSTLSDPNVSEEFTYSLERWFCYWH